MKPTPAEETRFEQILRSTEASLGAAAGQVLNDEPVRKAYIFEVQRGIADIRLRFARGQFATVEAAATEANLFRNTALRAMRIRTSPLGLVIARNLKDQGLTLNEAIARYSVRLFGEGADFNRLKATDQAEVFGKILERSAVTNMEVSLMLRRLAPAARGVVIVSLAYAVYEIATAPDKGRTALREGSSFAAGVAGGAAGGALAGLACGPGAPVCVTVGAFVGGALAAFGVELAFAH